MIRDDAAEALARAEFFDICDDEQRRMLAFAGDIRQFTPDAVVYKAGEIPRGAHVLIEGVLTARPSAPGGKSYSISEPGSLVSSMALILAKPRTITITSATNSKTLFVPRHAFMKLVQQSPELAQRAVARIEHDIGSYLDALEPARRKMKARES